MIVFTHPKRFGQVLTAFCSLLLHTAVAQNAFFEVPPSANSTSAINRGPNGSVNFHRAAAIYPKSNFGNCAPQGFTSMGFRIVTPAASIATGTIKIYLGNTTNQTFTRSTTWSTLISSPTPLTLVYDGPLAIPAAAGWFDLAFTAPFAYTGNGIYMAYEWTAITNSTASATYAANNQLTGGVIAGIDANALPATLNQTSAFRPGLRFGYVTPASDASVLQVFGLGKIPAISAVQPQDIDVLVANLGASPLVNLPVSLTISGATAFSGTETISSLLPGDTAMVRFNPATSATGPGQNTIVVTLPSDNSTCNNSDTLIQEVTTAQISYTQGSSPSASTSVGFNTGSGTLLNRYVLKNNAQVVVPVVRLFISNNQASLGKTVFAVVLDANGILLGRSADHIITSGDQGAFIPFPINNAPTITAGDFYVGMAQTADTAGYFPLGAQSEPNTRDSAYFTVSGDTAFLGGVQPNVIRTVGRLMIAADLVSLTATTDHLTTAPDLALFPNPANGKISVQFSTDRTTPAQLNIINPLGQIIEQQNWPVSQSAGSLDLTRFPKGIYLLQFISNGCTKTQRLILE
jgi:hypothetical protein